MHVPLGARAAPPLVPPAAKPNWVQQPVVNAHGLVGEMKVFLAERSFFKPEGQDYIMVPSKCKKPANQSYARFRVHTDEATKIKVALLVAGSASAKVLNVNWSGIAAYVQWTKVTLSDLSGQFHWVPVKKEYTLPAGDYELHVTPDHGGLKVAAVELQGSHVSFY